MAYVKNRTRRDGGTSYSVHWREGGSRGAPSQTETFSSRTDRENKRNAEDFRRMVELAGERWPDNWVKGYGLVEPEEIETTDRTLGEVGLEYVNQIVDCSPGQRSRYRGQLRTLETIELERPDKTKARPFAGSIAEITEADLKLWLIQWDRSLKTKANYHGLLYGVFTYAVEQGLIAKHPALRTAPKRAKIKAGQADLRFLREAEFATMVEVAPEDTKDLLAVTGATGMRFGEVTAIWVEDIDFENRTLRINKSWKRDGDDGEQAVPAWLKRKLRSKHEMRGHHLGNPKTASSKRTIVFSPAVSEVLKRAVEGKVADDFVFTTATGRPIHHADFYESRWTPLMGALAKRKIGALRFHDLRHTHVAWLIAGNVSLPHIQKRMGHESITTTIDTYGHLLPQGDDQINEVIELVMRGEKVRPVGVE